jgi:hypothetical protein
MIALNDERKNENTHSQTGSCRQLL